MPLVSRPTKVSNNSRCQKGQYASHVQKYPLDVCSARVVVGSESCRPPFVASIRLRFWGERAEALPVEPSPDQGSLERGPAGLEGNSAAWFKATLKVY